MTRKRLCFFLLFGYLTAAAVLAASCRKEEKAELIIAITGTELSDAYITIDEKIVGSLTPTRVSPDGKVYINGVLAAKLPSSRHSDSISHSACSETITLVCGRHTISLGNDKKEPLSILLEIPPGKHLLSIFPDKGVVYLDGLPVPVGPDNRAIAVSR